MYFHLDGRVDLTPFPSPSRPLFDKTPTCRLGGKTTRRREKKGQSVHRPALSTSSHRGLTSRLYLTRTYIRRQAWRTPLTCRGCSSCIICLSDTRSHWLGCDSPVSDSLIPISSFTCSYRKEMTTTETDKAFAREREGGPGVETEKAGWAGVSHADSGVHRDLLYDGCSQVLILRFSDEQ